MKIEVKDDKLLIEVDVSPAALAKAEVSKSGKTRLVATTHGFAEYGPVKVSLNVTCERSPAAMK
jgi:hypothetical protein